MLQQLNHIPRVQNGKASIKFNVPSGGDYSSMSIPIDDNYIHVTYEGVFLLK